MMKNIRINKRIKSNSKEKEKKQKDTYFVICQQKQNSNSKGRLPKIDMNAEAKSSIQKQKHRRVSIIGEKLLKNERKLLTLSNHVQIDKQNFSYSRNLNSINNVQSLNQTQRQSQTMNSILENFLTFSHSNDKINLASFHSQVDNCQNNIQNNTQNKYYNNCFQNFEMENKSKNSRFSLSSFRGRWFSIERTFSYQFNPFKQKLDFGTQTLYYAIEDKYFHQYAKHRQLKTKNFKKIQQNDEHFNQIINQTWNFKKNYQSLINYLNESPENDREKRVFALSQDLMKSQSKMKSIFDEVSLIKQKLLSDLNERYYPSTIKKQEILNSTKHLIKAIILQPFSIDRQSRNKTNRILHRILKQLEYFTILQKNMQISQLKSFESYHKSIQTLESGYSNWSKLLVQNRVLIYNFMKQLSRIPETMISLFGYDQQLQNTLNWNDQKEFQSRLNQYLGSKCDKCYETKRKIRLLQFKNQQIKPIVKALEWLIRDKTHIRNCLECI